MILFYGAGNEYGYMSNFYKAEFEMDGITFQTVEQAMHYKKAMLFGDTEIAEKILDATNPLQAKRLGRKVTPFISDVWDGASQMVVYKACLEKFRQNPKLKEQLLSTGNEVLVEASPSDKIWGIGRKKGPVAEKMENWNGKNKLGFALMMVREELR